MISDDLCFVVKGSVFACCDGINLNLSWFWYVRLVCFLLVLDDLTFLGGFGRCRHCLFRHTSSMAILAHLLCVGTSIRAL